MLLVCSMVPLDPYWICQDQNRVVGGSMGRLVLMQAAYLKISRHKINYYISSCLGTLIWAPYIAVV